MRIDEDTLRAALHDLPHDVPDDLLDRVHHAGRRRLRRRRLAAVATTTACLAAAGAGASAYLLDSGRGTGNGNATVAPAGAPAQTLYAAPPAAGADCASGSGGHAAASAQPKLLWLPRDTQVRYAFVRAYTDNCPRPHVALTMLKQDGGVVTTGVVVSGPNAPTAEQAGMEGHGRSFAGDTGHSATDAH